MTNDTTEHSLESWKEIAAYLKRDVTTVRRWEKTQGLPVRRHLHELRSSVFAYPSELDTWWAGRTPAQDAADAPPRIGPLRLSMFAAALLLAAVTSGDGLVRPIATAVQAQGVAARQLWAGPTVDTTGDVAQGGRTISFVDWETGDLAIRDLSSGESRRVTNKGTWAESIEFALFSTFSPDATRLAYTWFTKAMGWELRVVPLDGGAPRVLHSPAGTAYLQPAAWSPDGTGILTLLTRADDTNQMALISSADGSARVLKTLDWRYPLMPVFSPDGRSIAFDFPPSAASAERDIFLMAADGSHEIPLVQHPANDFLPAWAPGGTSVVFLSDRAGSVGLWMVPVADGKPAGAPRLLKGDIGRVSSMRVDRDGSLYYALETGMTDVYMASIDVAAGMVLEEPTAVSQTFVGTNRGADWSPDGRELAYLSQRVAGPASARSSTLVIRSVETGAERTLVTGLTRPSRPRWSGSGRRLLVYGQDRQGRRGMFAIDARTGAASLLFALGGEAYVPSPAWPADGGAVFYTYPGEGGFLLRMRTIASGADRILFRANALNLAPSPDGTSLAFTYPVSGTTENRLVVLPLAGGTPRQLHVTREPEFIAMDSVTWTPDGKHLLFAKRSGRGPHSLWRVPAEGGEAQKLNLTMEGNNVGLRIHPDGRRVAFTSGVRASEIWVLENLLPASGSRN